MRYHTFLFKPGRWSALGEYFGLDGGAVKATGEMRVSHEAHGWRKEEVMRLHWPDQPLEFASDYRVRPFDGDWTTWEAETPGLGLMRGEFVLAADTILSLGQTLGGAFTLSECLVRLDEGRYLNRGALIKGAARMSSWAVELVRAV